MAQKKEAPEEKAEEKQKEVNQPEEQNQNKKSNKKAIFYIVMILLCLAVVAGLIISSFNKKLSADELICQRMNEYLERVDYKFTNYNRLVSNLEKQGYFLDNLSPSMSDNHFVFNQEINRFALVKDLASKETIMGELSTQSHKNWVVSHKRSDVEETNEYSHYLAYDYQDSYKTIEVNASLDCGTVDPFTSISYVPVKNSDRKKVIFCYNKEVCQLSVVGTDLIKEYPLVRPEKDKEDQKH